MILYRGYSAPSPVHQQQDGMWTFNHFPNGEPKEFGRFFDESAANREREKLNAIWEAENNKGYIIIHR
ncbi:MAG TPA: hypothetical protein VG893_07695 [Terracidiphilus sp.]|nr:hypothetical protein [Terracidiphilus sp.]